MNIESDEIKYLLKRLTAGQRREFFVRFPDCQEIYGESDCVQCGQCCRMIPVRGKLEDYAKLLTVEEYAFIKEHWHNIEKPTKDPDIKFKRYPNTNWYACDLLNNQGLCSIYGNRLGMCQNYPIGLAAGVAFENDCPAVRDIKKNKRKAQKEGGKK